MRRSTLRAALAAGIVISSSPLSALTISNLVVFGDSNVDIGRLATEFAGNPADGSIVPPNTVGGRNSNGTILPEFISERVGVSQLNYAWSGAQAGDLNIAGILVPSAPDLLNTGTLSQIEEFRSHLGGAGADADALYLIVAGSNDLFFADKNDQSQVDAAVSSADANLRDAVTRLTDAGARNIVVATRTPRPVLSDAATPAGETDPDARNDAAGRQLNAAIAGLVGDLNTSLSSDVYLFDTYELTRTLIDNSGANGFAPYAPGDFCQPAGGPQQADCSALINFDAAHKTSAVHSYWADNFIDQFDLEAAPSPVPLPAAGWLLLLGVGALTRVGRGRAA